MGIGPRPPAGLPPTASELPPEVQQLHSSEYRRASDLRGRIALVVGSGSSGVQICQELATSARFSATYLAVSGNRTIPWRLLGIPAHSVLRVLGVLDMRRDSWLGSRLYRTLNETGDAATPPTPRQLAKHSAVQLVGHLESFRDGQIGFSKGSTLATRDLSIVWCTGFRRDYGHIEVPDRRACFDEDGPIHERRIVASAPGLCFVGLRFQHTVSSHLLYGVGRDAAWVAGHIAERHALADGPKPQGDGPRAD